MKDDVLNFESRSRIPIVGDYEEDNNFDFEGNNLNVDNILGPIEEEHQNEDIVTMEEQKMEMIPELVGKDENSNNEERDVVIVEDVLQERIVEETTHEDDDIRIATEDTTHEYDDIRSVAEEMEEENEDVPNENVAEGSEATGRECNLSSINNMDYSHRLDHTMYNPAINQSYDV